MRGVLFGTGTACAGTECGVELGVAAGTGSGRSAFEPGGGSGEPCATGVTASAATARIGTTRCRRSEVLPTCTPLSPLCSARVLHFSTPSRVPGGPCGATLPGCWDQFRFSSSGLHTRTGEAVFDGHSWNASDRPFARCHVPDCWPDTWIG